MAARKTSTKSTTATKSALPAEALRILTENAQLFRFYEENHRGKADEIPEDDEARAADRLERVEKAERNAAQAEAIEKYLKKVGA